MRRFHDFQLAFIPQKSASFDYDFACVIKPFKSFKEYQAFAKTNPYLTGVELRANTIKDLNLLAKKFKHADYLVLSTSEYEVARYAIKKALVDALLHNESRGGIDHIMARECEQKKVAIDLCFRDVLGARKRERVLQAMRDEVRLALKYDTPLMLSSGARNEFEIVPKNNLIAFGEFLGLSKKQSKHALQFVQEKIIERKKHGYLAMKGIKKV
ncbi:hypothetical protein COT72_04860 [archaeon CG10_big_fil_rev_8_21_14_0_10_43_11]|nr:MAG: hypothetical protein COT72_04860 [archaeon CG10_big_fil_rev_8_21_14_0_10_43_11]